MERRRPSTLEPLARFERATYGLRKASHDERLRESSRIDENAITSDANPSASTRIDERGEVDRVLLHIFAAQAAWVATRDRGALRCALLQLLLQLEQHKGT
jgi:hypothetical protein